jgi:hypothetical protein
MRDDAGDQMKAWDPWDQCVGPLLALYVATAFWLYVVSFGPHRASPERVLLTGLFGALFIGWRVWLPAWLLVCLIVFGGSRIRGRPLLPTGVWFVVAEVVAAAALGYLWGLHDYLASGPAAF